MFSCIVAGRPVITQLETISQTQFAFNIPSQPSFSHLVVFLLPDNALPPGSAAAVYIQIPPAANFKLLGAIANDKQSAVFKVNAGAAAASTDDAMTDAATSLPAAQAQGFGGPNVVVGISIEPIDSVRNQLAELKSQSSALTVARPQQPVTTKLLAQRIIKNAFNFLSSFAGGTSGNEVIPLKAFQDWWNKFEKKIELDPSFLERDN